MLKGALADGFLILQLGGIWEAEGQGVLRAKVEVLKALVKCSGQEMGC